MTEYSSEKTLTQDEIIHTTFGKIDYPNQMFENLVLENYKQSTKYDEFITTQTLKITEGMMNLFPDCKIHFDVFTKNEDNQLPGCGHLTCLIS